MLTSSIVVVEKNLKNENSMNKTRNIVVVGGGPAGVAITLALHASGFKVSMIERSDYNEIRVGEHLLPGAKLLLTQLGVPRNVWAGECLQCSEVQSVWGSSKLLYNESIWSPYGGGLILNRSYFDSNLADYATQCGASVYKNTTFIAGNRIENGWICDLKRDDEVFHLKADFLIDATGRSYKVVKSLGYKPVEYDKLICIAGFCKPLEQHHPVEQYVLLEACKDGWWYSIRLFDGRIVATYMTDIDILSDSNKQPHEFWSERLHESPHTCSRLDEFETTKEVHVRPSQSCKLEKVFGHGWLAVGDAAMSCDPLSSAGILKGFKMGMRAAQALESYFSNDSRALIMYDEQAKEEYSAYLRTRSYYYRFVTRWPNSEFWTRRHTHLPSDTPIYLDPMAVISLSEDISFPDDYSLLNNVVQDIDVKTIFKLASSVKLSHQLVSIYKEELNCQHLDREIVFAIQFLIESGYLKTSSQGTGYSEVFNS